MRNDALRWLLGRHRYLKKWITLIAGLSALMGTTAVLFAYFSMEVLDAAIAGEERVFIIAAITLLAILLVQLFAKLSHNYLEARFKKYADLRLSRSLYAHLLNAKHSDIEKTHSGTLMNYLQSDVRRAAEGLVEILPKAVFLSLRFILALILLLVIDVRFSAVYLGAGAVILAFSFIIRNAIKRRHNAQQDAEAHVREHMQEHLHHIPLIKAFESEGHTLDGLEERQSGYFSAFMRKKRLTIFAGTGFGAFFAFGYLAALLYGGYQIFAGVLTFGSLVAILQLIDHIQSPFSGFSQLVPKYYAMKTSAERLMRLEAYPPEHKEKLDPFDFDALRMDGVSFSYDDRKVLNAFSLTVDKGDLVHIQGPSGIGKTTLFKLLLALETPDEGEVYFTKEGTRVPVSPSTRSMFSYVPQDHMMRSGTIRENLALDEAVDEETLESACEAAAILTDIRALPEGFETDLAEHGTGLSEGQIQRLAIARALIRDAPVLLLDEVTASLDAEREREVLANLSEVEGKTCLVISHRPLADVAVDKRVML